MRIEAMVRRDGGRLSQKADSVANAASQASRASRQRTFSPSADGHSPGHSLRLFSLFFTCGVLSAFGFWTRFSFAFALVILSPYLLYLSYSHHKRSLIHFLDYILGFLCVGAVFVVVDSLYYGSFQRDGIWEITPINNLLYNMDKSNLALHTLHPRYLHALVNFPLLFGPLGVYLYVKEAKSLVQLVCLFLKPRGSLRRRFHILSHSRPLLDFVMIALLASYLFCFSMAPHQEMRFLLPLAVPVCFLLTRHLRKIEGGVFKKLLLGFSAVHMVVFIVIFGYLHQGGVVPSLRQFAKESRANVLQMPVSDRLFSTDYPLNVIYSHTYMPPKYLLDQDVDDPKILLHDVAGDLQLMQRTIDTLIQEKRPLYLVTPASLVSQSPEMYNSYERITCMYPHLSMEDPPRSPDQLCLQLLRIQ
eukprot:CAMPEP_0117442356 /NCGR_PEP_ID=MMETSP0759-20121206/4107_1 /TAXON_ID=63605 /ORGANISM="Percolomonas cosmopolitus, Strain WS" /LENGTH=416 /DNA_ID=CAMNT_0005234237 /DNA_START=485 /DNA_END=1735 /DNA_ORIENTATION=-